MSQMGRLYDQDVWDDEPQHKAANSPWLRTVPPAGPSIEDQVELIRAQTRLALERKQAFEAMERAYSVRLELEKRRDRKWKRMAKHKTDLVELETRLVHTEKERDAEAAKRHETETRASETVSKVIDAVERVIPGLAANADAATAREVTETFLREESSLTCLRCHHTPLRVYMDSIRYCPECNYRQGDPMPDDGF